VKPKRDFRKSATAAERSIEGRTQFLIIRRLKSSVPLIAITPQSDLTEELSKKMTFTVNVVKSESFDRPFLQTGR
jgi:hypothetical protein